VVKNNWWWDASWNRSGGCSIASPGCRNCYAARAAGTLQTATNIPLYLGTTDERDNRYTFNNKLTELDRGDPTNLWPLLWPGAKEPVLGKGKPSLIFISDMSDLFHEDRPTSVIDRTLATVASSNHIGLVLTKRTDRMAEYFKRRERWKSKLWLGFSAENQNWFDRRWPAMRQLAERGWLVFVSIAPMLGPVKLPDDSLTLLRWVICSGEQGPLAHIRHIHPDWVRAVRDRCAEDHIAFFMKQMSGKRRIPRDLQIRQFPRI
jgi:protein gp37